jgi:hypothetical protein
VIFVHIVRHLIVILFYQYKTIPPRRSIAAGAGERIKNKEESLPTITCAIRGEKSEL